MLYQVIRSLDPDSSSSFVYLQKMSGQPLFKSDGFALANYHKNRVLPVKFCAKAKHTICLNLSASTNFNEAEKESTITVASVQASVKTSHFGMRQGPGISTGSSFTYVDVCLDKQMTKQKKTYCFS